MRICISMMIYFRQDTLLYNRFMKFRVSISLKICEKQILFYENLFEKKIHDFK